VEAILYLDRTGCAWRYLPGDFPPWQTVYGYFAAWRNDAALRMNIQIVAKRDRHAFEILPRRWVVERTFAWISKHRRTVRDYEHLTASHEAMILWAMIALMTRRLTQPTESSDAHLGRGRCQGITITG
jgi:transposase